MIAERQGDRGMAHTEARSDLRLADSGTMHPVRARFARWPIVLCKGKMAHDEAAKVVYWMDHRSFLGEIKLEGGEAVVGM